MDKIIYENIQDSELSIIYSIIEQMVERDFQNCFTNYKTERFYSPFILGLIGIFLFIARDSKLNDILKKIEIKLLSTYNTNGLYNFYGTKNYSSDVDTTSIVNAFIYLSNIFPKDYHLKVFREIINNRSSNNLAISTWFEKKKEIIDWLVNFNCYFYFRLLNQSSTKPLKYIKNNYQTFLRNGSYYYKDISFPLFLITFFKIEFEIDCNFIDILNINITESFFNTGKEKILNKKKVRQITMSEIFKKRIYFNSKDTLFYSIELNAAIALYLIHKEKHEKNKQFMDH